MRDDRYTETKHGVEEPGDPDARRYEREDDDDESWLDEGTIALLLVVGVALFLFPEPATSGIGVLLIAAGLGGWLVDALS